MTFNGKIKNKGLRSSFFPINVHQETPTNLTSRFALNSWVAPESAAESSITAVTHPHHPQQWIIHSPTWVMTQSTLCCSSSRDISSSSSSLQSISGCEQWPLSSPLSSAARRRASPLRFHKDRATPSPWWRSPIEDTRESRWHRQMNPALLFYSVEVQRSFCDVNHSFWISAPEWCWLDFTQIFKPALWLLS